MEANGKAIARVSNALSDRMTGHARLRTAQRNISDTAITAALSYGKTLHRTGRIFYILRHKDIRKKPEYKPFVGTTVLLGHDGAILTVYQNPDSHRLIKKKQKRRAG